MPIQTECGSSAALPVIDARSARLRPPAKRGTRETIDRAVRACGHGVGVSAAAETAYGAEGEGSCILGRWGFSGAIV
jgi:hypothetical protein